MPLPFLHAKKAVGVIVAQRGKRDLEVKPEDTDIDPVMSMGAEDLLRAIDERSISGIVEAMKMLSGGAPEEINEEKEES